jgi:hypothetical protein
MENRVNMDRHYFLFSIQVWQETGLLRSFTIGMETARPHVDCFAELKRLR